MSMVVSEVDGVVHRASVRNEPRMLIEVETDRVGSWGLMEQSIDAPYPRGGKKTIHKQQIVIYEHQWPLVQKMVRTDAHIAMLADAMASAPQTVPDGSTISLGEMKRRAEADIASARPGPTQSIAAGKLADAERDIAREAIRLLCLKPGMQDGLPPLTSARVIKSAPPPPTPQNLAANQHGDLAAVLRQLLAERDAPKSKRSE